MPHEGAGRRPFAVRQLTRRLRQPSDFRLGARRLGAAPEPWRAARAAADEARKRLAGSPPPRPTTSRANWSPPWYINTEHFEIQTNVTLAEAISFGRRLEAFHDLFMALLADILGENLPLARRFKDPSMTGEPGYKPHSVYYFGSKSEYVDHLSPATGAEDRGDPRVLRPAQVRRQPPHDGLISFGTRAASCR